MSELPLQLQVELRDAMERIIERGEPGRDFDEAITEGDRLAEEMLSIPSRNPRPIE
jgi:hypothetical protein